MARSDANPGASTVETTEELFEDAPCGYLAVLPDGTIVRANATFLRWTGYNANDLVGRRRFQDILSPGARIYHETHYAPLLRMQGFVREIAVDIVRSDGSSLPALVNSVLHRDESGEPVSIRTVIIDATERREYERELLRARRRAEESEAHARELAKTLQASLIPPTPPVIEGLDIAAAYRPAGAGDEVGGDFYDVFETRRGDHAVFIGDVCGKGVEAATITALARYTIHATTMRTTRPRAVLSELNTAILRHASDRFATVLYARMRFAGHHRVRVTLACGGHPLPFLTTVGGSVEAVGKPGTLLGVFDQPPLYDATIDLQPGEALVLYTDGVTEARDGALFFGEERLAQVLALHRNGSAQEITNAVVDEVVAFAGGRPRDDMALITLKVPPR